MEYHYHHDAFDIPDDDAQIGHGISSEECAQYHDRELWYWEGQNMSSDRLNKIQNSDHVKFRNSVILRHVTRWWIYFINQKLHGIIKTNPSFSWWMMDWTICTHEQFWFFWSSWASRRNCNENQIYISRSFRIPVVLVKMKWEDVSPQKKYIYIYIIFVKRDTDVTVNEQEYTSKKLIKKFFISRKSVNVM